MPSRKNDEQLNREIAEHRENAKQFLRESHEIHKEALQIGMSDARLKEHNLIMNRVVEFQKLALAESKKARRLEKYLLSRQLKRIRKQQSDLLANIRR